MVSIGTPFTASATKVLLLGSGELGKELAIECLRLGCEVIACDSYANAPAMQVAQRSHVFSMLDGEAIRRTIEAEKPDFIVPEVEAIATATLVELEEEGFTVVPSAKAVHLTMNREGIRTLAARTLGLPTSEYHFADNYQTFCDAASSLGYPCFVKPIMSSSGKGQSKIDSPEQLEAAWKYAQEGGRAGAGKVIVEGMVDFDFEITLLTLRTRQGTDFCAPIGHVQKDGDYQQSWQPQPLSDTALAVAKQIAATITESLGGYGLFGVELFIKGNDVIFSEVSPRPHDTGMVTLISQNLSEFALHARAILGLPVPTITCDSPSASAVLLVEGTGTHINYSDLDSALLQPYTDLRLFGKPKVNGKRRMGVALAKAMTLEDAVKKAKAVIAAVKVSVEE
ncbi:formate-dependent phosphoribosylglycinamide formyltransferase [Alteromonas pelagimontana]|uniref:Formate-dependent phosphoribosylglycinamide formyltransferase n=1 Tax=Alteromonas pelagimontana TaxID=1858656 RepID=A0A6M4ME27_9ALTE|nr:formate-dependent phosphoribosylglycinamide formyltransferase [Alteromonas pelagimontana]QJR81451.1 formate-dependent phosphoribosylglycinamide formyltransferase [Alteromonas pelagimontana]